MNINPEHENILKQLQYFIAIKKIPNIVFHGSCGSGKRTIVHNFIYQIYGGDKNRIKSNVMFVNCAQGKGIRFIRDELKYFAKANIQCGQDNIFKSIILMNADELTIDAQSALRRCIELFSHNTRFFIIVENKYKLLNPILSRFCEIYIPDKMIGSSYTNLHELNREKTYALSAYHKERRNAIFDTEFADILRTYIETGTTGKADHVWFLAYANRLYEEGISCNDLIQYLQSFDNLGMIKTTVSFCYEKIKSEYRCEKLALMYLFDFLFFRSNKDLKNISFI